MKRYDTLPDGVRGVYLRVMRSLGNQLTSRGVSGIRSVGELGFIAERVGRIPREGEMGIFSIAKSYRGVFERIAEDDFRAYVINKRLLQTRVVGFDGDVVSVDVLDLSGFDESDEEDVSVAGCDVDDGFEDVETVDDEDEDGLDFEDVDEEDEDEDEDGLDFEDVDEEDEDEDEDGLDFEDVDEEDEDDSLDFEDVDEDEDDDNSLDFEDVEEEDEDDNSLDFEDVEEEDEDDNSLDFEDVEEEDEDDNSLDFEDVEEEDEDDNSLAFEDVEEEDEDDNTEEEVTPQPSNTIDTTPRRAGAPKDSSRRPSAQQTPPPGIRKDWSRIRGVEGNESMETVLSGVESLFSKLSGRRS